MSSIYTLDGKDLVLDQSTPHYFVAGDNCWIEVVDAEDGELFIE